MQASTAHLHRRFIYRKAPVYLELLQLIGGIVARVEQQLFIVVHIREHGLAQVGRNNDDVVVIGLGVVDIDFLTREDLADHLDNLSSERTGVFEHGHALLAGDHVLHVGDVAVLTGDERLPEHW